MEDVGFIVDGNPKCPEKTTNLPSIIYKLQAWGHRGRDRLVDMQSVPIATNVVSSNPAEVRCTQYNIM